MKRKMISIGLALTMILCSTTSLALTDISGHWASNYIRNMYIQGVIAGYPDETFRPNNPITRAEAATLISKFFAQKYGYKPSYLNKKLFSDIGNGHWADSDIVSLSRVYFYSKMMNEFPAKIINGYEDGTFRPDKFITRAEFMKMWASAMDAFGLVGVGNGRLARSDVYNHWSEQYFCILDGYHIIEGQYQNLIYYEEYGSTRYPIYYTVYNPEALITRAEVATVMYKSKDLSKKTGSNTTRYDGERYLYYYQD